MDLLTRLRAQPLPFAALLGIDLVSAEPEKIVGEMTVRPEFCTRPAVLHVAPSWPLPIRSVRSRQSRI
jgi:1,4-dihydroxy-2-naphthoyl-CoA hydrolase